MTKKRFDIPSFVTGIIVCLIGLYAILWCYEYGYDFFNQYGEFIGGFLIGFVLMYAIHKIDWEVGF